MAIPKIDNPSVEATIVIGSFRYYLGRQSYAVSDFCKWLRSAWAELDSRTKNLIQNELEETFKKDDEARADGQKYLPLGMDMDRKEWERVRKLY